MTVRVEVRNVYSQVVIADLGNVRGHHAVTRNADGANDPIEDPNTDGDEDPDFL
jgi:hypothetical protein